jgi:hypothetical protein
MDEAPPPREGPHQFMLSGRRYQERPRLGASTVSDVSLPHNANDKVGLQGAMPGRVVLCQSDGSQGRVSNGWKEPETDPFTAAAAGSEDRKADGPTLTKD